MEFGGKIEQGFHVYDSDPFLDCAGVSHEREKVLKGDSEIVPSLGEKVKGRKE